jgi:uncharacterized OB-fold protein
MIAPDEQQGTVYTETVVFSPPQQFAADAPYQLAILSFAGKHERRTVRILASDPSDRVAIGDDVEFVEERDQVPYYRRKRS